jgi:hypothetical protein
MGIGIGEAWKMFGVVGPRATARTTASAARTGGRKTGLGLLLGGSFVAGIGSTDPVHHTIGTFERDVMGDAQFSERILGRQMGAYGAMGIPGGVAGYGGARGSYMGMDLLSNAAASRPNRGGPPGSMVFGMFNSRMN